MGVQSHIVFLNVSEQVVCAQNLCDFHQLIVVVLALEEWLLLEDHACEHATQGPYVEGVVVGLEVDQELRPLEVSGGDSDIVLLLGVVELSKTPINKSQTLVVVVDHDIMRFHISVHYALRVAVIQGFQHLVDVESNVVISEAFVEGPEVYIACVNVLHDQRWGLRHWVSHHINQVDDVYASPQSLQNFDLSSYLGLFDGF